jgi:hypothetical protein
MQTRRPPLEALVLETKLTEYLYHQPNNLRFRMNSPQRECASDLPSLHIPCVVVVVVVVVVVTIAVVAAAFAGCAERRLSLKREY